jgi:predicted DNA-binding protein with PD1-like motif
MKTIADISNLRQALKRRWPVAKDAEIVFVLGRKEYNELLQDKNAHIHFSFGNPPKTVSGCDLIISVNDCFMACLK